VQVVLAFAASLASLQPKPGGTTLTTRSSRYPPLPVNEFLKVCSLTPRAFGWPFSVIGPSLKAPIHSPTRPGWRSGFFRNPSSPGKLSRDPVTRWIGLWRPAVPFRRITRWLPHPGDDDYTLRTPRSSVLNPAVRLWPLVSVNRPPE